MTKLTKRKKLKKKKSDNYEQTICTSTRHGQNICEVSKQLAKNCRRSCAHKSIVDERTGHSTPISHLRANAGATKMTEYGHFCNKSLIFCLKNALML